MIKHRSRRTTILKAYPPSLCCGNPKNCQPPTVYLTVIQAMIFSWLNFMADTADG